MTARAPLLARILPFLLPVAAVAAPSAQAPVVEGELRQRQPVLLTFTSPIATSEVDPDNPFRNYRLNVRFTRPDGTELVVPGYYAADGDAAETGADAGDRWRVHLLPDQEGSWAWEASFRTGPDVAAELDFDVSGSPVPGSFDGESGTLAIGPFDPLAPGMLRRGPLQDVDEHFFRFEENHEYFLKGGANSPENFLAYYEFDDTFDLGGLSPATPTGLHHFDLHLQDFDPADPVDAAGVWQGGKGGRILGAINYLAGRKINGMYFLTYSIDGGDSQDTWMWHDPSGPDHKLRYDVSKLAQWERVFSHMDARGIQMHVVTQEIENDQVMGGLGLERKLYYRELVARFGHHPALLWNVGEENTSSSQEQIAFAAHIRALDPYDHPITVHTLPGAAFSTYAPLYGSDFEATSIQGSPPFFNDLATNLRNISANAGDPWPIYVDEQFSPSVLPSMSNLDDMREQALWGNLMGGGAGVEWYFGFGDVTTEDFRIAEPLWRDTSHALDFFRDFVHPTSLVPNNDLTAETDDYVLEEPGETYVVYRRDGGGATLALPDTAAYDVRWYDPRIGGELQEGTVVRVGGSAPPGFHKNVAPGTSGGVWIGLPPHSRSQDWVALVRKSANRPPVVLETSISPTPVSQSGPVVLRIRAFDPDGPDDVASVGMLYTSPSAPTTLQTALAVHRGGDLYTISRREASILETGLWTYTAAVTDEQDFAAVLPGGTFTVVP